jgi:outer membrane protein OmpA-like peptidoglycan-associated protein
MKPLLLLSLLCLAHLPLQAQVTIITPGATAPTPPAVVVQQVGPTVVTMDAVVVRKQLSLLPKVITLQTPAPTVVVTPVPQETIKTTKTTTVVDAPGRPRRVYNSERSVVLVEEQDVSRELPYVTLPVLFVKETAELLDAESRASLEQVAGVILEVSKTTPGSVFDIEGHTSTDGTDEFNATLSAARAQRIYDELVNRYGVPVSALSAHGYGESFPMFPEGTEEQMQQDRRVLVVRTK